MIRINKVLSNAGVCSRREADSLLKAGQVKINGVVVDVATKVDPSIKNDVVVHMKDKSIVVDLEFLKKAPKVWMHNKKTGVIVSTKDSKDRACLIPQLLREMKLKHLIPIGRLDLNSEGLILLTNSGDLARQATLPSNEIPRYYRVRVRGKVEQEKLDQLSKGTVVKGISYGPVHARIVGKQTGTNAWVDCVLKEGKNRELRKIFQNLGYTVSRLVRLGYGPYRLPRELSAGQTMEVQNLFRFKKQKD